jgi:AhpD family alkylhydroperoxidase
MTWVRTLTIDDLPPAAAEIARGAEAQYGRVLETWATIFNRPEIFEAYMPFLRAVAGPGELPQHVKDLSALLVGWLNGCRYTVSHRAAAAMRNGATEQHVVDVALGRWESLEPGLVAALRFAEALTLEPTRTAGPAEPFGVPEQVRSQVREHFDDAQIVELTMSLSIWNGLSRYHRVMGLPLDMPPAPEPLDSLLRPTEEDS